MTAVTLASIEAAFGRNDFVEAERLIDLYAETKNPSAPEDEKARSDFPSLLNAVLRSQASAGLIEKAWTLARHFDEGRLLFSVDQALLLATLLDGDDGLELFNRLLGYERARGRHRAFTRTLLIGAFHAASKASVVGTLLRSGADAFVSQSRTVAPDDDYDPNPCERLYATVLNLFFNTYSVSQMPGVAGNANDHQNILALLLAYGAPAIIDGNSGNDGAQPVDFLICHEGDKKTIKLCLFGVSPAPYFSGQMMENRPFPDAFDFRAMLRDFRLCIRSFQSCGSCKRKIYERLDVARLKTCLETVRDRAIYGDDEDVLTEIAATIAGCEACAQTGDDPLSLKQQAFKLVLDRDEINNIPIADITDSISDFDFLMPIVCAMSEPPAITELCAWQYLYHLNDNAVMSRAELTMLMWKRCFPNAPQPAVDVNNNTSNG